MKSNLCRGAIHRALHSRTTGPAGRHKWRPYKLRTICVFASILLFPFFANAQPRNVLLITIDTLRADYLGCNGSGKVKTPNIDSLEKRGVNFTRARSAVPMTLPSHATIMTGLYPPSHGVRDNGRFPLKDSFVTLAEVFRKQGYGTAAFIGSFVLDHRFGLAQGFEFYDDNVVSDVGMLENPEAERNADSVLRAFLNWYSSRPAADAKPFFVWIHFYDPHAPYLAPSEFAKQYPSDPYAAEVAYTDSVVGKVLKSVPQNTLIALIGDHGEGLGEHQESTHSILIYNSTLHVPFILSAPGILPEERKISALTRTIDLAPTLLDLSGIPEKIGEGVSLKPLLSQQKQASGLTSYSESLYPKLNLGWSELRGIEEEKFHYIMGPDPELYDLSKDPREEQNVIRQYASVAQKLQALIPKEKSETSTEVIDPETKEKLRSLGYVSGSAPPSSKSVDPKSKMALWNRMQQAMADFHQGRYSIAAHELEKISATDPDLYLAYEYLSSAYIKQGVLDRAEKVIARAQGRSLQTAPLMSNLGVIQFQRKDYAIAEATFRKAIELDPMQVSSFYYLGVIRRLQKKPDEALVYFEKALKINPRYTLAWNGAGMSYSVLGEGDKALEAFHQVVSLDPRSPQGYFNLAVQLEQMKRNAEAIAQYKKFLDLTPTGEAIEQRNRALAAIQRLNSTQRSQRPQR